jgi:hypothetical protein
MVSNIYIDDQNNEVRLGNPLDLLKKIDDICDKSDEFMQSSG